MPETRSTAEIFEDLRELCRQPGFLHAITFIKFRDFYVSVDRQGDIKPPRDRRYSRATLNHNEFMLLMGLLVQSDTPQVYEELGDTALLVARADELLEELHTSLEIPMREALHSPRGSTYRFGDIAKEAMYYGPDSAFVSQYQRFARDRYRRDFEWLLSNTGLSVRPMIVIARWMVEQVTLQLNALLVLYEHTADEPVPERLTPAFLISKDLFSRHFGARAAAFLHLFSVPINRGNEGFGHPFAYNAVNSRPLIDLGAAIFVSNQYKLFESVYESPYYWMLQDDSYRDIASTHRGAFLEITITRLFVELFGKDHVFTNAIIRRSNAEVAAEADVLVIYGEFILVVQAKSKRLTMDARAGNDEKIHDDFKSSVQSAYEQATRFIELMMNGMECDVGARGRRKIEEITRVFPIVVLSDHFPSLTWLTNLLIARHPKWAPVVVDLFFLDVLCDILAHPVDVLYYLQQRARFFDRITTDSEYNLLGYHLSHKLYVADEWDFMLVDRDFAHALSEYVELKEHGIPFSSKFLPLEQRVDVPVMTTLISSLKAGPPGIAGIAIELLDFSEEALESIADNIGAVQAEVRAGKPFKAFSLETHYGGVSYVAVNALDKRAVFVADTVARKHKYNTKKDRWYVLLDHIHSRAPIDAILPIHEKWVESGEMQKFLEDTDILLKETTVAFRRATSAADPGSPEQNLTSGPDARCEEGPGGADTAERLG